MPKEEGKKLRERRVRKLRPLLFFLLAAFLLADLLYYFVQTYANDYFGFTNKAVRTLSPMADASPIVLRGPDDFRLRTRLALAMLSKRAPSYWARVKGIVADVDELPERKTVTLDGQRLNIEVVGALSQWPERDVYVRRSTAFNDGRALYDRDVFIYASTLVHEAHHLELARDRMAPGGVEEEVLCEKEALRSLQMMGAPQELIDEKLEYLANPTAARYRKWYDWYKQFKKK
jgi:hypothetical protein